MVPWPLFICPTLVFPSLSNVRFPLSHALSASLSFTFTLSSIIWFSLDIQRSFIHYFPLFTLFSLCSLKFIDVSTLSRMFPHFSFHSSFSPFIHASIRGTCFSSQCSPGSPEPCRGLCALTFERCLHDFFVQLFCQPFKNTSSHLLMRLMAAV